MKIKTNLVLSLFLLIFCSFTFLLHAQTDKEDEEKVPEKLKYFKEKYEEVYETDFETAWQACEKFILDRPCQILTQKVKETEEGRSRGVLRSELCIFAQGDTVFKKIQLYSLDPPFIRGGVWTSGRMQYTFIVTELENNKVNIELKGEISGFENHVTFKAHFFQSRGLLEFMAFEYIADFIKNNKK